MHIGSAERQLGSQVTALKSIRYQAQGDDDLRWDIEAASRRALRDGPMNLRCAMGSQSMKRQIEATLSTDTMLLNMDRKHVPRAMTQCRSLGGAARPRVRVLS